MISQSGVSIEQLLESKLQGIGSVGAEAALATSSNAESIKLLHNRTFDIPVAGEEKQTLGSDCTKNATPFKTVKPKADDQGDRSVDLDMSTLMVNKDGNDSHDKSIDKKLISNFIDQHDSQNLSQLDDISKSGITKTESRPYLFHIDQKDL